MTDRLLSIMRPGHPLWDEFVTRLEGPEGCDFQQSDPEDYRTVTWRCDRGIERPLATAILKTMPGIDVKASLEYFDDHGGYCDCEILFNVNK